MIRSGEKENVVKTFLNTLRVELSPLKVIKYGVYIDVTERFPSVSVGSLRAPGVSQFLSLQHQNILITFIKWTK